MNPPCKSLIATAFINVMNSLEKVGEITLFAEPIGSGDEGGLETDKEASKVSLILNSRVVTDLNLVAREGKQGVRSELEKIEADVGSHADCQA